MKELSEKRLCKEALEVEAELEYCYSPISALSYGLASGRNGGSCLNSCLNSGHSLKLAGLPGSARCDGMT